jgi:carbamoyltransferase
MNILGLHGTYLEDIYAFELHDSGASLVIDGKLIVSILEERLTRRKFEYSFPFKSIEYVLNYAGIKHNEIDIVSISDQSSYNYVQNKTSGKINVFLKKLFPNAKIHIFDHHLSHAASAVLTSNFNNCSVLTMDGGGSASYDYLETEYENFAVSRSIIGQFKRKLRNFHIYDTTFDHCKNMFGYVYSLYAEQIYKSLFPHKIEKLPNDIFFSSPGKIMGLASYGNHNNISEEFFRFEFLDSGRMPQIYFFNRDINWFKKYDPIDIAAYLQHNFEKAFKIYIKQLLKDQYLGKNVCFAGGVFLNISCNTILQDVGFKNLHIVPFVNDSGLTIGSSLYSAFLLKEKIDVPKNLATLGKKYSNFEIKLSLKRYNLDFVKFDNSKDLYKIVAKMLSKNKIVGWFQNRSEQGPRALGSRSILMSCNKDNKDILNYRVKHREYWRPFAGAVLEEKLTEYFEQDFLSPYMLYNYSTKPKARNLIPSVNHIDNTCRAQTVNKELYPELFTLLTEYYKLTQVAVLLNTSFNDNNEPIVETPDDAIKCFLKLDLDCLAIGDFLVLKHKAK